ncbi:ABC transporter type 1, transmembrane domain-containing protein, partial [Suillus ampliporus]
MFVSRFSDISARCKRLIYTNWTHPESQPYLPLNLKLYGSGVSRQQPTGMHILRVERSGHLSSSVLAGPYVQFPVIGDMGQLMGPLVLRQIVVFAEERSAAIIAGTPVPNVGRGIAMAIGLFALTMIASVCTHQAKPCVKFSNAALLNHISTDVTRIDACAQWFHAAWTTSIQVTVCLIILLTQLGPSTLAGFSLFVLFIPFQNLLMALQHRLRSGSMKWTDQRAKVLLEVFGAIRVVKYFSYEVSFLQRIFELRKKELHGIRRILHLGSANMTLAMSIPVLAATLAFVAYTLTTHSFSVAVVFSSLSLFQLLWQPMVYMPRALSSIPDASSAIKRLTPIFQAELISEDAFVIDKDQELALLVKDATFDFQLERGSDGPESSKDKSTKEDKAKDKPAPGKDAPLFRVKNVTMTIPRVQFVARIDWGDEEHVSFGGRIGYCQQTAWIQNATLRDNITFGRPFEEDRYWRVLETACLLPDLQLLPDGGLTEVNIARALYFDPEIVIFDNPLSADYIYTINNGVITESGTYYELISRGGDFARLDMEFGGHVSEGKDYDQAKEVTPQTGVTIEDVKLKSDRTREKATGIGKLEGRLMVKEKRSTDSLSWRAYWSYLVAGRGWITRPLVLFSSSRCRKPDLELVYSSLVGEQQIRPTKLVLSDSVWLPRGHSNGFHILAYCITCARRGIL